MEKQLKVSYSDLTISEFYENYLLKKYDFDPEYQRDSVWSEDKKQFLIDSILKNFPIPPIFLKMNLNPTSGKTIYDVIDGKQRLQSIIGFIEGRVYLPDNFSDGPFGNEELNGLSFNELDQVANYKKNFWSYKIPIAYIDTDSEEAIDGIFDRLNRNGSPLTPQELRNALYKGTELLKLIKSLAELDFWRVRLEVVKTERLEHHEFISELLFMQITESIFNSTNSEIDDLYEKWSHQLRDDSAKVRTFKARFKSVTEYLSKINLDYERYRFEGVSHIYGIWVFANHCEKLSIDPKKLAKPLIKLMQNYRDRNFDSPSIKEYKRSMIASTRQKSRRLSRVNSIIDFVNQEDKKLKIPKIPK
ncbi:MAG: DUF262 domain-containing protein [Bacteroidetes bacterium]|nr:DUF262 domain-containing protein [Bacteroidota bacterium]